MVVTDGDYRVTGVLDPDSTGDYEYDGEFDGQPSYVRMSDGWYIWWSGFLVRWVISAIKGNVTPPNWTRVVPIAGNYAPTAPATGIATVTEI